MAEVGYSGLLYRAPWLFVLAAGAIAYLAVRDRRAAAWFLVPVLWPAWEYSYLMMIIPVVGPWLGLLAILLPGPYGATAVVFIYAARLAMDRRGRRSPALPALDRPAAGRLATGQLTAPPS